MTPTLVTSCTSLPPEGAELAWGGPALRSRAPTLVAAHTALPPEAYSDRPELVEGWGGPALRSMALTLAAAGLVRSARQWLSRRPYDSLGQR